MENENKLTRKLQYALEDILKRVPAIIQIANGESIELGGRERWFKTVEDSLHIIEEELDVLAAKPQVKLTEREKLVPLCNELASLSSEERQTVLERLTKVHEYQTRLEKDL